MLVLDTHIWLWWMAGDKKLKPGWQESIAQADRVGVSAISLFEVAWLVHNGRIELGCDLAWWFEQALTLSEVELLDVIPEIAMRAVSLESHHSDPQDRLIIATAIQHQANLMSVDQKFKLYRELDGLLIQA
ncbi:type II toxin-antitoxin system VapC family toxin [Thiomicrospira microaerophila]|uniref:type II toxin-antitoxin system VapC family toxin n=1 Tax=Thiomicrospira microaerophila TaxID=406020 RepID=UPI0005C91288|nr:type II toxin-antitoxin system VapC family toxin [Thiomicrospira microaerophila]